MAHKSSFANLYLWRALSRPHLRKFFLSAVLTLLICPLAAHAELPKNSDCMMCHDDKTLTKTVAGKTVKLDLDYKLFQKSVHGTLKCVECHADIKDADHDEVGLAQCATCHEAECKQFSTSIHNLSKQGGASEAATCTDCHGNHYILPIKNADSPVFKMNLPTTCARCHSNAELNSDYRMKYPQASAQYMESIHGRALLKLGLVVAPSCNDCHGVHDIKRAVEKSSPINPANVATTCGKCHAGIEKTYEESVHGTLLAKKGKRGPNCVDCHTAHQIDSSTTNGHKHSDQICGKCHEDRLIHYEETYHGKAMALGKSDRAPAVASCHNCHGAHDVFPTSDPRSRLSPQKILHTCQECHPGAGPKFTEYLPHANPMDSKNYPGLHRVFLFMTALLIGVFCFFGVHTGAWIFRSLYIYMFDSKTFNEAKARAQTDEVSYTRFKPIERVLHLMVVTSFLLLVVTGMPLKFYYTDWAKALFELLGGTQVCRSLHHFGAVITFLYFALHIASVTLRTWRNRAMFRDPNTGKWSIRVVFSKVFGPDSMLPSLQDGRDFIAHQKWFFGKGPRPQFDRWTYWEKFDYMSVFWGVTIIGVSGLIMWFPVFFTKFLSGWIINAALIVHSDEALLAAGFIFTFHFFNTHFRIERFPMDTVIFTGRISKSEMLHERKTWYDRLVQEDRLDQHLVKDNLSEWKSIIKTMGFSFFGLGLVLLVLIVYAMTSRLMH